MNIPTTEKLFSLGRILITSRAHDILERADVAEAMGRHAHGDWGQLKPDDMKQNDLALREGGRLVSAYHDRTERKFFIITEADRSVTTVLLAEDY
jgi:hypothetical protein